MMNLRRIAAAVAFAFGLSLAAAPAFSQAQRSPVPSFPYTQDQDTGKITFRVPVEFGGAGSVIYSSTLTPAQMPRIYAHGYLTGTAVPGINAAYSLNNDGDNIDATGNGVYDVYAGHSFGGAAAKGYRTGGFFFLNQASTTGNLLAANAFYTALGAEFRGNANDNGTGGARSGNGFAANFIAQLTPTATNWKTLAGLEIDVGVQSGATVDYKSALSLVQLTTDAARGVVSDVAFLIANQVGGAAPGWTAGILFGNPAGWWPMAPTATMIGSQAGFAGSPVYAASYGIDFSTIAFSQAFLKSAGFSVGPVGEITGSFLTLGSAAPAGRVLGTVANAHTATDAYNVFVIDSSAGGANPQTLAFGISQASLYSEIQASQSGVSGNTLYVNRQGGLLQLGSPIKHQVLTVATLPTCNGGSKYYVATVSDAAAPTYNANATGGGAVTVPVQCDGTNWKTH